MLLRTANLVALGYEILHRGPILSIAALCVLNGILRAFFDPVASAMVADLAAGEHRIAAFSLQRIGVNIGWVFGTTALGFTRALHMTFGHLFYASAVVTLLAALAASAITETRATTPTTTARPPLRLTDIAAYRHDRRFMRFLLATFFFFLLQAQLYATLSLYAADHLRLKLVEVSHLYTENGGIVLLLSLPAFYYIRRVGTHRVLVIGSFAYAASYALCGLATRELHLLICVAFITLAETISAPAQQTAAVSMAPVNRIGAYAGMFGLAQAAGQSLGPFGRDIAAGCPPRSAHLAAAGNLWRRGGPALPTGPPARRRRTGRLVNERVLQSMLGTGNGLPGCANRYPWHRSPPRRTSVSRSGSVSMPSAMI